MARAAQDCSASKDGGVARDYSLLRGWATSYPETTGYIVPTLLEYARRKHDDAVRERARRMLDWLVSIQLPAGGFQGGRIDSVPVVPVTFNTGQILIGLAAGQSSFGTYEEPLIRAADWLVATQDEDGCWRIARFNPEARILYIMRHPIKRTISHYWYMVNFFGEGRTMLKTIDEDPDYRETSYYAMQLRPYIDLFGKDTQSER